MKVRAGILAPVILASSLASGQSLFDSGRGDSAILFSPGASTPYQLQVASGNSVYSLSYSSAKGSARFFPRYGFVISGKGTGAGTRFQNNAVGTAVGMQVAYRLSNVFFYEGTTYDEIAITAGVDQQSNTLFDTGSTTFSSKALTGTRFALDYWAQPKGNSFFIGARVGISRESNVDDLTSNTFVGIKIINNVPVQISKSAVLANEYQERVVHPARLDALYEFTVKFSDEQKQTLGLDFFAKKNSVSTSEWQPGLALLAFKSGDPLAALGGISASWLKGKLSIGIFAGYKF